MSYTVKYEWAFEAFMDAWTYITPKQQKAAISLARTHSKDQFLMGISLAGVRGYPAEVLWTIANMKPVDHVNETVHFRLFNMPCCGQLLCWVNPRLPNHCPECGKKVLVQLRQGDCTTVNDPQAHLKHSVP